MLFTDRDLITVADILEIDPEVAVIADAEDVDPTGVIRHAVEQCANRLMADFQGVQDWSFSFYGGDSIPQPRMRLAQVVVDSETTRLKSPMQQYALMLALRNFYTIAANRKIDDRHEAKAKQLDKDLDKYLSAMRSNGLPIVSSPTPCPGALFELQSGTWDADNVAEVEGGNAEAAQWDVSITWVTATSESGPSETIKYEAAEDHLIQVDISSLNPPANVTAWKLWIGLTCKSQYFQATIPIATKTFTLPDEPVISGEIVGRGQSRDATLTFINAFHRG